MFQLQILLVFIVISAYGVAPQKSLNDICVEKLVNSSNWSPCLEIANIQESEVEKIKLDPREMLLQDLCFVVCVLEEHCLPPRFRLSGHRSCDRLLTLRWAIWRNLKDLVIPVVKPLPATTAAPDDYVR